MKNDNKTDNLLSLMGNEYSKKKGTR